MAILDVVFQFFFFIIFLLPRIAATNCGSSSCHHGGPSIRFPFRLAYFQQSDCGYSVDFDLSCNTYNHPILTLPSSGGFGVASIDYIRQTTLIVDLNLCMHNAFLNKNFTLSGTPFRFSDYLFENYTYFKCPSNVENIGPFGSIGCLGGLSYNVFAVPSSWSTAENRISPRCRANSTALLPSETSWMGEFYSLELTWNVPDCSSCEVDGLPCGFNVTSSQIMCSRHPTQGISSAAKKKVAFGLLFVAWVMCIIVYACRASGTRREAIQVQETNVLVFKDSSQNYRPESQQVLMLR